MLAAAKRREDRLNREAEEQKLKDEIAAKHEAEKQERLRIRAEERAKMDADIAAGIIADPRIQEEYDLDHLTAEEQMLLFGEDFEGDDIKKYCNAKNKCRLGCFLFWFIGGSTMIGLIAGGVFASFLTDPCWQPSREAADAIKYYNTTAPLPNEDDRLIDGWKSTKHEAFVLPSKWCNNEKYFLNEEGQNETYLKHDEKYKYGRYYIKHAVGGACLITETLTLDSMCSDPNKTVAYAPSPSSSSEILTAIPNEAGCCKEEGIVTRIDNPYINEQIIGDRVVQVYVDGRKSIYTCKACEKDKCFNPARFDTMQDAAKLNKLEDKKNCATDLNGTYWDKFHKIGVYKPPAPTKKKKKKKIRLKDPCWLTIQGETTVNTDYWDWEKQEAEFDPNERRRNRRQLFNQRATAIEMNQQQQRVLTHKPSHKPTSKKKKKKSSPDPFVPTSMTTTCRSTQIIVTERGRGGLPQPVCNAPPITTVLDGGGIQQLFRITTGAKVSLRDLKLRNFRAGGNCFCKAPHQDCGGGVIFVMDKKSHFYGNNLIMTNNQAWMGGAIFGNLHATISLVSVQIVNNLALKNDSRICQGGGYGGALYMYNATKLTTICTDIQHNTAGDSGGGVLLQQESDFVAITSTIMNNTAAINVYYEKDDPTQISKQFSIGKDIRMYDTTKFRAVQRSRVDERDVYPYIDVKKQVYLEMYYSKGSQMKGSWLLQIIGLLLVVWIM